MSSTACGLSYALQLRRELSERNRGFAVAHKLPHVLSFGECPVVAYEPFDGASGPRHGNFLPATYEAILSHPQWLRRLRKPHSQARQSLPANGRRWMELDSCNSSDALLMNVFSYPRVFVDGRVDRLLGVPTGSVPEFGVKAKVPLKPGRPDRTEVDMRLGNLLVEAKLTENDFQCKSCATLDGYRDFAAVFDRKLLPRPEHPPLINDARRRPSEDEEPSLTIAISQRRKSSLASGSYVSYQLIRNVLAAQAMGCCFCVIHDARRPDLREAWYAVMRAVRNADLRTRCQVLTWQELASALPPKLQRFLDDKYGIREQQVTGNDSCLG